MDEGTLLATLLHALVSNPHRLRAYPVLSKVGATEPIDDFSKPEEVHFLEP